MMTRDWEGEGESPTRLVRRTTNVREEKLILILIASAPIGSKEREPAPSAMTRWHGDRGEEIAGWIEVECLKIRRDGKGG